MISQTRAPSHNPARVTAWLGGPRTTVFALAIMALAGGPAQNASAQQVTPSVLNVLRYGDGTSGSGVLKERFSYFEGLMDVRISLPKSFTVGARFLYDAPPEIGPAFRGIKRRFAEYSSGGIFVRAGHSSQLFGRGLALNLFEDRALAYDTWLDGVKMGFDDPFFRITAVAGRVEYWDSVVVARTETYDLRAANAEVDLFEWITVGVSFVETEANLPGIPGPTLLTARIPEVYASFRTGGFEGFAGWSQKRTDVTGSPVRADGGGIYGALSWTGTGVGVTMDYKDYRYDISDPYSRYDPTRPTRMLPVQNPPIVQREHSWTFLTRALHEVNFNDEVGMQLEGFFKVDDATTVTVNASLSSEHDYFLYQMNSFSFVREPRLGNFLPSMDARLSPYWELLVEGEHYSVQRGLIRGAIAMRQYTQSVLFTSGSDHVIRSLVLPALVQVGVDDMNTLTVQGEFEAVSDNYNDSAERYENYLLALSFTMPPGLTLAARAEFTSNPGDLSGRRSWFAGEVGYRLGGAHSIALTAGQERGGKVCTNGVCRSIQPFNGVRLAIQSNM